jgi:hypothetical protein
MMQTSSRGIKRPHSTIDSIPDENKFTSISRNHEMQRNESGLNMRRLVGTPLLGGNIASRSGKARASTPPQYANRVHRQPAPKARRPPLPFTYGSEVSLDPAILSTHPDPIAVQQIKLVIPVIPRLMNGQSDMAKMIGMLIVNARMDLPTTTREPDQNAEDQMPSKPGKTDTPGADFDLLFNNLTESGLVPAKSSTTSMGMHAAHVKK